MKLPTNQSTADRVIRLVAGITLLAVSLATAVAVPWLYAVWLVAAILVVTGAVGFCPLYAALGLSTKRQSSVIDRR